MPTRGRNGAGVEIPGFLQFPGRQVLMGEQALVRAVFPGGPEALSLGQGWGMGEG